MIVVSLRNRVVTYCAHLSGALKSGDNQSVENIPQKLLRVGSLLLLCAWVLCLQHVGAQIVQAPAEQPLPSIALTQQEQVVDLAGRSRYWIDDTGRATVADAQAKFGSQEPSAQTKIRPIHAVYALHHKAMWLRFEATNQYAMQHWLLQVNLPTVDDVSLYFQDAKGDWKIQQAGDSYAHTTWPIRDRYPLFNLDTRQDQSIVYFLRVAHGRVPFSAGIDIMSHEAVIKQRQVEFFWLGSYFGMMLVVIVVSIAIGLAQRYANFIRYAAYVSVLGFAQLAFLGLGTQFVSPNWLAWNAVSSFVMPAFSVSAGLWLVRALLRPKQYAPMLDRWVFMLVVLQTAVAIVEMVSPSLLGFHVSNAISLVALFSLYTMVWSGWRHGDHNALWIAAGFLPVVLSAFFPILRNFGVLPTGFMTQYAVTLGSGLEAPILLYALFVRSANLRESRTREQALIQKDPLTGLSNERYLLNNLHGSLVRANRYKHAFAMVFIELKNHDWFIKEHGKGVADRALILAASRLRIAARDVDTAAKLDGNQFVVLLEGPVTAARAVEAATRILSQSLHPTDLLPIGSSLKLQISAALMPDTNMQEFGEEAAAHLAWLIDRSLHLDPDPRKTIRSINF